MLRKTSLAFGIILLLIGAGGFISALIENKNNARLLLGILEIDTVHNIIHLASGAAFLYASQERKFALIAFRLFGFVYGLVAIVGLIQKDTVLGLFQINGADNILHLVIAGLSLLLGFGAKDAAEEMQTE